jgi:redox-sensitive bicupin YhaK (pirin superfamily)
MGNGSKILPGDVQFMSAGTGVTHSEFNGTDEETTHLLQMWILPDRDGMVPRYDQKSFPESERLGRLRVDATPDGADGSNVIAQDARLAVGILDAGRKATYPLGKSRSGWLHVARGSVKLNGKPLGPGDGAAIRDEETLTVEGVQRADVVLFDLP